MQIASIRPLRPDPLLATDGEREEPPAHTQGFSPRARRPSMASRMAGSEATLSMT